MPAAQLLLVLLLGAVAAAAAVLHEPRGLVTRYPGSNLLAARFPNDITARYNSTVMVLPIARSTAQALIPAGVRLLPTHPVPGLAADQWPLFLQAGLDQDLRNYGIPAGDFYVSRLAVPWTDQSGDGKTPFLHQPALALSVDALPLITRLLTTARLVYALFTPNPGASADLGGGREGSSARTLLGKPIYEINVTRTAPGQEKYSLDLFLDFANQGYANATFGTCVYHPTTYDLPGTNPYFVTGDVTLGKAFVPGLAQTTFKNVQGLRAGEHFLEMLFQPCVGTAKFPSS